MQTTETAALLEADPEQHARRCTLAKKAIDAQRWPAAACGLRHAAGLAEEWAAHALRLADWCDAQAKNGTAPPNVAIEHNKEHPSDDMAAAGAPTTEAIEAGLLSLARALGHGHAVRVRSAMNGVLRAQLQLLLQPSPAEAAA